MKQHKEDTDSAEVDQCWLELGKLAPEKRSITVKIPDDNAEGGVATADFFCTLSELKSELIDLLSNKVPEDIIEMGKLDYRVYLAIRQLFDAKDDTITIELVVCSPVKYTITVQPLNS